MHAALFASSLFVTWLCHMKSDHQWSFNGTGTTLYGLKGKDNATPIQTIWITWFYLPILPVRSIEGVELVDFDRPSVLQESIGYSYQQWSECWLDWPHVRIVIPLSWGALSVLPILILLNIN
tara:strand:- start:1519 stop:1884 length:366 start_codon:yes stop_codon:yes gene_type:complete